MLPRVLCEHLCSLNPNVDRLGTKQMLASLRNLPRPDFFAVLWLHSVFVHLAHDR